ncbi:MAG: hypothetical protein WBN82_13625, partial [Porticoccaceae bacterium]
LIAASKGAGKFRSANVGSTIGSAVVSVFMISGIRSPQAKSASPVCAGYSREHSGKPGRAISYGFHSG